LKNILQKNFGKDRYFFADYQGGGEHYKEVAKMEILIFSELKSEGAEKNLGVPSKNTDFTEKNF
jgi:hypothetical protein